MKVASQRSRVACTRAVPAQRFGVQGAPRNRIVHLTAAPAQAIAEEAAEYKFETPTNAPAHATLEQPPHRGTPSRIALTFKHIHSRRFVR